MAVVFPTGKLSNARLISPSDTRNIDLATDMLYVGVGGDITLVLDGDTEHVTLKDLEAGWYKLDVKFIRATGTTAKNIIAFNQTP